MLETLVNLDFDCSICGRPVGVTLKCEGKGLLGGMRSVAAVQVACPNCSNVNRLCFEPCGIIRDVAPARTSRHVLEPSVN